jgi:VIT1/CCC1 family predicted Fe2+/Mn2+ transporter
LWREDALVALRISNIVSFIILFILGYRWGRYTGANPWKFGALLVLAGVLLMAIAIPLGG